MKKTVVVFGLISGLIITGMMVYQVAACCRNPERVTSEITGYATMLVAFAFIFIGIRHFRDKYQDGLISFGKAFRVGFLITLIASTMYVLVWLIDYHFFVPDFMDKYTRHMLFRAKADGATAAQLNEKAKDLSDYKELYKNPLFFILISFSEVLPIGLVITLISAAILKRKRKAVV